MKMKNFCSAKDLVERMKRQMIDWEKILAKHTSDNGLISRVYKELSNLNRKNRQFN